MAVYTDEMSNATPKPESDPFLALVAKLVQTPKAVVDKREAEYQKSRAKKPRCGPKPGRKPN